MLTAIPSAPMGDGLQPEGQRPAKRIKLASAAGQCHRSHYPHHHQQQQLESRIYSPEHKRPQSQGQQRSHPYPPSQPAWRGSTDAAGQPAPQEYQHPHFWSDDAAGSLSQDIAMASMDPTAGALHSNPSGDALFDASWNWQSASPSIPSSSASFYHGIPSEPLDTSGLFPPQAPTHVDAPPARLPMSSAPPASEFYDFSPSNTIENPYSSFTNPISPQGEPHLTPVLRKSASHLTPQASNKLSERPTATAPPETSHSSEVSPFHDCIGTFGLQKSNFFHRPSSGQVNGYIKIKWSSSQQQKRPSVADSSTASDSARVVELNDTPGTADEADSYLSPTSVTAPKQSPSSNPGFIVAELGAKKFFSQSSTARRPSQSPQYSPAQHSRSPTAANTPLEVVPTGNPKLVPRQFGYEAKMDHTDRQFWTFYVKNWCPGRTVLEETNLWLADFAKMHKSDGVRSAIQSLAGIYIFDYMPLDSIKARVNERFLNAETRFTALLNDPATREDPELADEFITMAVILSMQDIVLTERRAKKPHTPRWLQGFRRGEEFLEKTDTGARFWKSSNVQLSSLRTSQTIMVGRAVILAQPLSSLPPPSQFDAKREASRFGWLLYGSEKDMHEIHGGCGFSKKLLHVLSQITYCAARMRQDEENPVTPVTAEYLLETLRKMRQWSSVSEDWENKKTSSPTIDWVQSQSDDYKIDTGGQMTDVSAEAWRIAAILYLQCRVFRLPRDHTDVLKSLGDLAKCIRIMPTSGTHFTAQAPLFPVFLLGLLATAAEHKGTSKKWFEEVIGTPVRSSVPPLYAALQHIWSWIDREIPCSLQSNSTVTSSIHQRHAWWEQMVEKVQQQEQEVPCLT